MNINSPQGRLVFLDGENFYEITHYDAMPPFFMSIVSPYDHWLFISSSGGLSSGRKCADNAIFPYYTVDKITENFQNTGSRSIIRTEDNQVWEPFMPHTPNIYKIQRNIYKNAIGNKLVFEEINRSIGLTISYLWTFSRSYGLVRKTTISSTQSCTLHILDGVQNILPAGVDQQLTTDMSNLLDAYKKQEQYDNTLALYTLSAIISDRAEPQESLFATTLWSSLESHKELLLSSTQLSSYIKTGDIQNEIDVRATRGAYLISQEIVLKHGSPESWYVLANLQQSHSDICMLQEKLQDRKSLVKDLEEEIEHCSRDLRYIVAQTDGLQQSKDSLSNIHHFANVLFNTMRGGYYAHGYNIDIEDFVAFIEERNKSLSSLIHDSLKNQILHVNSLKRIIEDSRNPNLTRLFYEYIPITFSRRHGDPSRPWNTFSIDISKEDGSQKLNYQGNWRDIFQNWEALTISYPYFFEHIITKFLNASSIDGYNPYRITREGIDWEVLEEDNPWSNIGYWGDHQMIYLLKLLEWADAYIPRELRNLLTKKIFSYSNVPYKIKDLSEMLKNPRDTIIFDYEEERHILEKIKAIGYDGKLVLEKDSTVLHVSFTEKILIAILTKISNIVPDSGVWMNTQRPEWNDANNALVGYGVSVVTLCYLRRFLVFLLTFYSGLTHNSFEISMRCQIFLTNILEALKEDKKQVVFQKLSIAGSKYRALAYENKGNGGEDTEIERTNLLYFFETAIKKIDAYLKNNKRKNGLYHSYNLVSYDEYGKYTTHYLYEMLEGQVAILSSGLPSATEAITILEALEKSSLYREDQKSYILYPYRYFPMFMEKNSFNEEKLTSMPELLSKISSGNTTIISKDNKGLYHFNANYHNAEDLLLDIEAEQISEKEGLLTLFEDIFKHKEFTGRSGTFFAYEGLGSIYWHMVSKLLLAVQETCLSAKGQERAILIKKYYKIRAGLGFNKTPLEQGAFPSDPYSHTPFGMGAKQPGMTGQVKEEILTRFSELGLSIKHGILHISPFMLSPLEFSQEERKFHYFDITGKETSVLLPTHSLAFTFCQVVFVYRIADENSICVDYANGTKEDIDGLVIEEHIVKNIIARNATVNKIWVSLQKNELLQE